MKNKYPFIIKVLILLFVLVNCSNSKELSAPLSLYKTGEAEKISHQSYDKAMTLWDIDYKEDYVVTDYGQSHVIISGKDDAPPLILLPGLFCDATMWYANVGELSKYFKVYSLDLLVYGGKSQPSGKAIVDINDYKLWFTQILNHYKLTKVTVAGLSYSSWISLALAREMPQAFSSVIL
ncbi:MAG: alpha/beta hydrolase, partial [Bacteroidales bacterium]|nr:alpha/beta hydrolase [Bacteroidales bacterium]